MTATYRRTIEPQRRPSERGGDKGTRSAQASASVACACCHVLAISWVIFLARLIGVGWRRRHGAACAGSVSIMTLPALATEASVGDCVCGELSLLSSMVGQTPGDLQARLLHFV
jgi:hypothetical protein